jgi:hypothetical protein
MTQAMTQPAAAGQDKVGCGCLGLIVVALSGTYGLAATALAQPRFALLLTALVGLALYVAARTRGYHLLSGFAWLALSMLALGASPILYRMIYPAESIEFLPVWLQSHWGPLGLLGVGVALLGWMLWQMGRTVSTAEAVYAIQLQAAARKVPLAQLAPQAEAALETLRGFAALGAWPLEADFLRHEEPAGEDALRWMPIKAILAKASPDPEGWITATRAPWLEVNGPWSATVDKMGPLSVGTLFCTRDALRYAHPQARRALEIPLTKIEAVKVRMHALEIKGDGQEWTFVAMHAWRLGSLLAFLRAFEVRAQQGILWAERARPGAQADAFAAIPSAEALREAVAALQLSTEAERQAGEAALDLATLWPTWRALGAGLVRAWAQLRRGEHRAAASGLKALLRHAEAFPEGSLPEAALGVMDDLLGVALVEARDWAALLEHVADLDPWGDPGEGALAAPGADPRQEALVLVAQSLHMERPPAARAALARARGGYPGAMLIEALERALEDA